MECTPTVITPKPASCKRTAPKPPRRGSSLGPVSEAVNRVLSGRETVAAAAWITGADPASVETHAWEITKSLIHQRDAECCTACLADGTDVHHRVRRSRGFSADPAIAFGFTNTTLLCGPCHRKAHDAADPEMAARGYRLENWQSPEAEPLMLFSYGESGITVWLTPVGEYSTVPPGVRTTA